MYIIGHQNKITGGRKMHDNYIVSYNVNLLKKNMSVKTYNNEQKQYKTIENKSYFGILVSVNKTRSTQ